MIANMSWWSKGPQLSQT